MANSIPNVPISTSENSPGTVGNVPKQDMENLGTPDGIRAERISSILAEILAETSPPIILEAPVVKFKFVEMWGVSKGGGRSTRLLRLSINA